jgi:hypothetical protein
MQNSGVRIRKAREVKLTGDCLSSRIFLGMFSYRMFAEGAAYGYHKKSLGLEALV